MDPVKHIFDKDTARSILKSDRFSAYPMVDIYEDIQDRTGLDFNASVKLLRFLPLFLEGEEHRHVRKMMAIKMASVQERQRSAVRAKIEELLARFTVGAEIDLIGDVALPLWRTTSKCLFERDDDLSILIESITKLFYPTLSLRKRIEINSLIQHYVDANSSQADSGLALLSMAALGVRPFVGSFALSIYDVVANNSGKKASEFEWPDQLSSSSLQFVDRTVRSSMVHDGHALESGDRLRCYTHTSIYSERSNVEALFGYGAHVCLGRTISEYSWRQLATRLSALDVVLVPLQLMMDSHSEPFAMPIVARIAVRAS